MITALDGPVGISAWHTSTARPLGVATIRALSVKATKGGTPFRSIPQPMSRSTMAPGFALAVPAGTATVSNIAARINGTSSLLPMVVSLGARQRVSMAQHFRHLLPGWFNTPALRNMLCVRRSCPTILQPAVTKVRSSTPTLTLVFAGWHN
jgi:hypothetical protein